jgi:hypothetical protein
VYNVWGKRKLARTRRGWEKYIKIELKEVGWMGVDWIDLAFVNTNINFRVPCNAGNFSIS